MWTEWLHREDNRTKESRESPSTRRRDKASFTESWVSQALQHHTEVTIINICIYLSKTYMYIYIYI